MSFKHGDRQRMVSAIWARAGKKQPGWRVRLDPHYGREQPPNQEALDDLARRNMLPDTRSLAAQLLGDPPPGRSALDKKREEAQRPTTKPWWQIGEDDGSDR